jgi:uroporphyrinogen decarboxylase
VNDLFLRACRREPVERTPIWIMRQAGRYLPEYREVRRRASFEELLRTPELAVEATLQPLRRFELDAAILFSDILVPLEPMGIQVRFNPAPVLDPVVRTAADVARLRPADPETEVPYVFETVRALRGELRDRVPLIGFCGAPFTLAAYAVEGKGSKEFERIKTLLFAEPATAHALLEIITSVLERYLHGQIGAGAQAIQIFDSWAGVLAREDYRAFALPYVRRLAALVRASGVPCIYFALNGAHLLEELRESGADVIGLDWRLGLAAASRRLDHRFVVQGNLDPCVLLSTPVEIAARTRRILEDGVEAPGHIFNLGHGILPETPVDNVAALVEAVHGFVRQGAR